MLQKQIQEEIAAKEKKLLELRKILSADTAASYKEASQTSDMIEMLELNIMDLNNTLKDQNKYIRLIKAVNSDSKITIYIVEKDGDPSQMRFSLNSPFGQRLITAQKGDTFEYLASQFTIVEINEK